MKRFAQFMIEKKGKTVAVPELKTEKEFLAFWKKLGLDDVLGDDLVNPETGEVMAEKGESKRKKWKLEYKKANKGWEEDWDPKTGFKKWDIEDMKDKIHDKKFGYQALPQLSKQTAEQWLNAFDDWYDFDRKELAELVEDPEGMRAGDYDVSYDIPMNIRRRDGKAFDKFDVYNIQCLVWYWNKKMMPHNITLTGFAQEGDKKSDTTAMFV